MAINSKLLTEPANYLLISPLPKPLIHPFYFIFSISFYTYALTFILYG